MAAYGHRVLAVETFTDPARQTVQCAAVAAALKANRPLGGAATSPRARCAHLVLERKLSWLCRVRGHAPPDAPGPLGAP